MSAYVVVQKTRSGDYFLTEDGSYDSKLECAKRFKTAEAAQSRLDKLSEENGWRGHKAFKNQVNPLSVREVASP